MTALSFHQISRAIFNSRWSSPHSSHIVQGKNLPNQNRDIMIFVFEQLVEIMAMTSAEHSVDYKNPFSSLSGCMRYHYQIATFNNCLRWLDISSREESVGFVARYISSSQWAGGLGSIDAGGVELNLAPAYRASSLDSEEFRDLDEEFSSSELELPDLELLL